MEARAPALSTSRGHVGTREGVPCPCPWFRTRRQQHLLGSSAPGGEPSTQLLLRPSWQLCRGHQTCWPERLAVSGTGCGQGHLCPDGGDVWPGVPVLRKAGGTVSKGRSQERLGGAWTGGGHSRPADTVLAAPPGPRLWPQSIWGQGQQMNSRVAPSCPLIQLGPGLGTGDAASGRRGDPPPPHGARSPAEALPGQGASGAHSRRSAQRAALSRSRRGSSDGGRASSRTRVRSGRRRRLRRLRRSPGSRWGPAPAWRETGRHCSTCSSPCGGPRPPRSPAP